MSTIPSSSSLLDALSSFTTTYLQPYIPILFAHYQHFLTTLPSHWQKRFSSITFKATSLVLSSIPTEQWYLLALGLSTGLVSMLLLLYIISLKSTVHHITSWTMLWLCACTIIHSWIELHFVFYRSNSRIANVMDLYSAGDYRYGRPLEAGTASMECITAVITGPLAALTAVAIIRNWSSRHVLQLTLCTCQMYGLVWFTLHPLFALSESLTTDPLLFWGIAFAMNAPWGIFPPILWYKSSKAVEHAFTYQQKQHDKNTEIN